MRCMIYQLVCWVNVLPNDVCDRSKRVFHGCVGEWDLRRTCKILMRAHSTDAWVNGASSFKIWMFGGFLHGYVGE